MKVLPTDITAGWFTDSNKCVIIRKRNLSWILAPEENVESERGIDGS
jgi:hypothetical protein